MSVYSIGEKSMMFIYPKASSKLIAMQLEDVIARTSQMSKHKERCQWRLFLQNYADPIDRTGRDLSINTRRHIGIFGTIQRSRLQ